MKNVIASLIALSSMTIFPAIAETDLASSAVSHCDRLLQLSDSQKLQIKELSKASEAKLLQLKVDIRKAKLDAELVLIHLESSKEKAALLAEVLMDKQNKAEIVKESTRLAILFDVLTPEQRIKKVKCEKRPRPAQPQPPATHVRCGTHGHYHPRVPRDPRRPGPAFPRPRPERRDPRPTLPTFPSRRGGRFVPQT